MTTTYLLPLVADLPIELTIAVALSSSDIAVYSMLLIALVLLNALFVAAEVALARIHESQLEEAVEQGRRRASLALSVAKRSQVYSAACQLGITASTIVLGAVGEPFVSALLAPALSAVGLPHVWTRVISFLLAITALTILHLIVGEQIPKTLSSRKPVETALNCSPPLRLFYLLTAGPVWFVETLSNLILRLIFRLEPVDVTQLDHTADELRLMVEETGRAQEVTKTEQEILTNALDLNELQVRDILTPRSEVVVLDVHRTFKENLEVALDSKHTRFPLVDGHLDNTLGLIHIKDLLRAMQRESLNLFAAKRDLIRVSEKLPLDEMLQLFLAKRAHIALVVDEFGGSVGLVMLDDVLDQVVGEILDEFDEEEEAGFEQLEGDSFIVEGSFPLHELADEVEDFDLEDRDVSTVGGYVTSVAGRIPETGEVIDVDGYEATILEADERMIRQIRFEKAKSAESTESETIRVDSDATSGSVKP